MCCVISKTKCVTVLWSQAEAVLVVLFRLFCVNHNNQNKFWIERFSGFSLVSPRMILQIAQRLKGFLSSSSSVIIFWGVNQEMEDDPFVFTEVSNVI